MNLLSSKNIQRHINDARIILENQFEKIHKDYSTEKIESELSISLLNAEYEKIEDSLRILSKIQHLTRDISTIQENKNAKRKSPSPNPST